MRVARPLYRSCLSCKNAFPTPSEREKWAVAVWSEACERVGVSLLSLPQDEGASAFFCSNAARLHVNSVLRQRHKASHQYEDEDHARSTVVVWI